MSQDSAPIPPGDELVSQEDILAIYYASNEYRLTRGHTTPDLK